MTNKPKTLSEFILTVLCFGGIAAMFLLCLLFENKEVAQWFK